jgi:hypothetical protein
MSDLAPDSRYKIALVEQNDECQMVVVGWDAPLCTFFFQVWEEDDETDEEPLVWGGYELGEMRVLEELQERVGPYAVIPPEILEKLREDFDRPWAPSQHQQAARKFLEDLGGC